MKTSESGKAETTPARVKTTESGEARGWGPKAKDVAETTPTKVRTHE